MTGLSRLSRNMYWFLNVEQDHFPLVSKFLRIVLCFFLIESWSNYSFSKWLLVFSGRPEFVFVFNSFYILERWVQVLPASTTNRINGVLFYLATRRAAAGVSILINKADKKFRRLCYSYIVLQKAKTIGWISSQHEIIIAGDLNASV